MKIAAMRRLGAEVRLAGADFEAAKEAACRHAAAVGARFVEGGAEPAIAEGAGTIGLELAAAAELDVVVVPLGGGALLAGVGTALRHVAPATRISAVAAAGAPAMRRSLAAGKVVETEGVDTVADGLAVRSPAPEALIMLKGRYDAVVAVSDADIIRAMGVAAERLGLIVEPAGAAGLAAILADAAAFTDQRTATVFTGGNISLKDLSKDNRHGLGCSRPCHLKSLMLVRKTDRIADVIFPASSNFITGGSDDWDSFDRVCPRNHDRPRGLFRRIHIGTSSSCRGFRARIR